MAHRAVATVLGILAILLFGAHPLIAFVLVCVAIAVVMNRSYAFGSGTYRAGLAFITGLWVGLLGVVTTLLGLVPGRAACPEGDCDGAGGIGNFLFVPGLLLLALGLGLLGWSFIRLWRTRAR